MKRLFNLLLAGFICLTISAQIRIPDRSLNVIKTHYPSHSIQTVYFSNNIYNVSLSDNVTLRFKKNGDLIEINGYVPSLLIPYKINNHILWNYPHKPIHYYHKHKKGYDLYFKGGRHLKYNKRYKLKRKRNP